MDVCAADVWDAEVKGVEVRVKVGVPVCVCVDVAVAVREGVNDGKAAAVLVCAAAAVAVWVNAAVAVSAAEVARGSCPSGLARGSLRPEEFVSGETFAKAITVAIRTKRMNP